MQTSYMPNENTQVMILEASTVFEKQDYDISFTTADQDFADGFSYFKLGGDGTDNHCVSDWQKALFKIHQDFDEKKLLEAAESFKLNGVTNAERFSIMEELGAPTGKKGGPAVKDRWLFSFPSPDSTHRQRIIEYPCRVYSKFAKLVFLIVVRRKCPITGKWFYDDLEKSKDPNNFFYGYNARLFSNTRGWNWLIEAVEEERQFALEVVVPGKDHSLDGFDGAHADHDSEICNGDHSIRNALNPKKKDATVSIRF